MPSHKSLQFEGFTLDLDRLCLHGPSGRVNLRRKDFEVLRYLAEHAGRVVSKEEIMNAVWPDVTVSDESLTQCISEVRHALGSEGRRIIKTVARRGYVIDVPISASDIIASQSALQRFDSGQSRETTQPNQPSMSSHPASVTKSDGPALPAPTQAVEPDRRQVTAMACGFGAAALAGRADPED
jgi:DNA-binding winged helix-turn-helix (wHTH) protein